MMKIGADVCVYGGELIGKIYMGLHRRMKISMAGVLERIRLE